MAGIPLVACRDEGVNKGTQGFPDSLRIPRRARVLECMDLGTYLLPNPFVSGRLAGIVPACRVQGVNEGAQIGANALRIPRRARILECMGLDTYLVPVSVVTG